MGSKKSSRIGPLSGMTVVWAVLSAVCVVLSVVVSVEPSAAASQNEVLTTVLYDGTPGYDLDDPDAATGTAPETHTPGDDGGPNNLVVRTHDQFAVRVDWNVNEEAATSVVLTVMLPAYASWTPDSTGMFAGCDPATSSFPDPQTLLCDLGDQAEGSNGVIRPVATLHEALDNTTFDVTATLTTDDDASGVSDGLDQLLTVSEAPVVDYVKAAPSTSETVTVDGVEGYVVLFPLTMVDFSQGDPAKGVGPINDAVDIELFDHMWNLTPSVRLATAAEMTAAGFAGAPCGDYTQTGAHVNGNGTWTCGAPAATTTGGPAGTGYPVVPITVSGFTSRPFPATLADGSANNANAAQITSGQVAVWLTKAEVDAAIANPNNPIPPKIGAPSAAEFDNAITGTDESTVITSTDDITEPLAHGTNSSEATGPTGNNNTNLGFGDVVTTGGGPGSVIWSDVEWERGPLQLMATTQYSDSGDYRYAFDTRSTTLGGAGVLPGAHPYWHGNSAGTSDFIGQVARGQLLTIQSTVWTAATSGSNYNAKIHGCVAFDTSHYDLVPFGEILVSETNAGHQPNISAWTVPGSNTGPLAHFTGGDMNTIYSEQNTGLNEATGESPHGYVVEFSNAPSPRVNGTYGITNDSETCDDSDGGTSGWIDATDTAGLAQFDTDGDGRYEGITRARYSIDENVKWIDDDNNRLGMRVFFQAQVKQDLDVNTDNQELFVGHSYSYGDRDATTGTPDLRPIANFGASGNNCLTPNSAWTSYSGNDRTTTTGWCNNRYLDDGTSTFDDADGIDFDTGAYYINSTWGRFAFTDVVRIVGARLGINKTNLDGLNDVKDNGQLVQFKVSPSVTGASVEALTNVTVTDNLPAHFQFVRFVDQPDTPGSSCTAAGQNITCRYSEADPAIDTGPLPVALAGGWPSSSDGDPSFTVEVMVTGAIANQDSPTVLANTATGRSSGVGPWDPDAGEFTADVVNGSQSVSASAFSYMPLPADEGVILKAVDTLEGECVLHPDQDPPPVGWGDRCSMIGFEDPMSFVLSVTNEGNTAFTDMEFVDVFPHTADELEPASGTNTVDPQGSASTLGDGRSPDSEYSGSLGFVSMTPVSGVPSGATVSTWVTGDAPLTVSRDPLVTVGQAANTWCDAPGGAVQVGIGSCPATADDVTATYTLIDVADGQVGLRPDDTLELRLTLQPTGHECDDVWTNTFGLRTPEILLPIRSNDVSIMVDCEYDLALEKTIDPAWSPGPDWLTEGATVIPFLVEVTNQGDPVEDFDITDYVDTDVFSFDPANNTATTTGGTVNSGAGLPFIWDISDLAAPVALIDGPVAPGETVTIPVNLTVEDSAGPLDNWAEISRFDSDGDPSNGDSDPDNPDNPSTGALTDVDSIPDDDQTGDNQPDGPGEPGDGETSGDPAFDDDGNPTDSDPVTGDEDDHDVAGIPVYDLELIKTPAEMTFDFTVSPPTVTYDLTVTNQGNTPVYHVDVTDYGAPGLTFASATSSAAAFTAANPTFTINSEIAPGSSETITVVYEMDLSQAPFTNAAEISAFDDNDDPDDDLSPFAVDVDSTPDAVNDDDVEDHDEQNNDPDGDGNLNEPTSGDEDDHDIETVAPYDLALTKTFESADVPLLPNGSVTMLITIENQAAPVATVNVVDYIDPTMWEPFDTVLNPDSSVHTDSTAAAGFSFTWEDSDPLNPVALLTPDTATDRLMFGETVVIPITLRPVDGFGAVAPLKNVAEISNFDNDTDPGNGDADPDNPANPDSGPLTDLDSTPDASDGNGPGETTNLVDDETGGDAAAGGDEDDHDPVFIPVYDLELIKTIGSPAVDFTATPPTVTYNIAVTNQGSEPVYHVDVTEYGASGLTYDPAVTAATWATESVTGVTDANPTYTIEGPINPGDSVSFPVVFQVTDLSQAPFTNAAEISAFDDNDDPDDDLSPLAFDVDSTPDAVNDDDVENHNNLNNDPDSDGDLNEATPGDEDDHDIETIDPFTTADPGIDIEKTTNGVQSDTAPGEYIPAGDPVTWTYVVTNTGGTALSNTTVEDSQGVTVSCDIDGDGTFDGANMIPFLAPGETVTCEGTGTAQTGPYMNNSTVAGVPVIPDWLTCGCDPNDPATWPADSNDYVTAVDGNGEPVGPVTDEDPSHYIGFVFDLALRKTLATGQSSAIAIGDSVTFTIEVFNQGTVDAVDVTIVDYLPATMTLNDPNWTSNSDGTATTTINSVIPAEGSVTVDVTVTVNAGGDMNNIAEITNAIPTDSEGNTLLNSDGDPYSDFDSTPDTTNNDNLTDNNIDGANGDEDDHDIATITVRTNNTTPTKQKPSTPLAFTGTQTHNLLWLGGSLTIAGTILFGIRRRKKTMA